jgi:hypothetical protein
MDPSRFFLEKTKRWTRFLACDLWHEELDRPFRAFDCLGIRFLGLHPRLTWISPLGLFMKRARLRDFWHIMKTWRNRKIPYNPKLQILRCEIGQPGITRRKFGK